MVTGGGSASAGDAIGYAGEGAHVVVLDINAESAAETARPSKPRMGSCQLRVDVTERESCRQLAAEIGETIGQVSVLVNNAGINRRNAFTADRTPSSRTGRTSLVNLNGVFNFTHAFLGQLRAAKGRIVNIASIQSFVHVRTPNSLPTPRPSTACSASPARWRRNSARTAYVSRHRPGLIETPLKRSARSNPDW